MIFFPVVNLSSDSYSDEENCRPSVGEDIAGEDSGFSMEEIGDSGSRRWRSFSLPSSEDVARAVAAAANAVGSPRPSVVFSSRDDGCDSPLKRIQKQMSKVLKGFSQSSDKHSLSYNPEVLTKQKRQWASFQLQSLDNRSYIEPQKLIESMVVVGLHPSFDAQSLGRLLIQRKSEVSEKFRFSLSGPNHSRVEPNFEPQVLFAYPPDKKLPLKYKDLSSFCFPGGVEVHAVQKSSSMSELHEILVAQEHLKQSELSFVFRLQVADSSTLYGCCVLVEELVDKPSRLISMISEGQPVSSCLGRYIFTTRRCYCILTRIPFFELHFGVLNRIFMEERLDRLTKIMTVLNPEMSDTNNKLQVLEENATELSQKHASGDKMKEVIPNPQSNLSRDDTRDSFTTPVYEKETVTFEKKLTVALKKSDDFTVNMSPNDKYTHGYAQSLHHHQEAECSEPSSGFQGGYEDRHLRSENDEADTGETSISGRTYFNSHDDILEWAKANNHGSLQIIAEYYKFDCPERGSTISFHPLEHLHPLEYHRLGERVLNISGSVLDLTSCKTSLERAEVLHTLIAEEEASALSTWAISCLCGSLRLEHVLTLFAGALLEKQIVFICSNLGILSASVLSMIPLIRPYQWQSLLMPVLPNDMLDFLDAPVPYIVGVQSKNVEVQTRSATAILVDVSKNQVKSSSMPQLPKQKELITSLIPFHSKLVEESFLGKKRPVYECTNEQAEATKGLLTVLRDYLNCLCSNLRSHTITNVQSNDDKVSLLLKESFIDSFPSRDQPFMRHFVDTQMFSVHTDLVLSFFQNE